MKILIFGASGFLGSYLKKFFLKKKINFLSCGRNSSNDIILKNYKENEIFKAISSYHPDVVLNLVGLTNVDECEKNINKAKNVNTEVVKNISNGIKRFKRKLFFTYFNRPSL